jgi:hypothetical protein
MNNGQRHELKWIDSFSRSNFLAVESHDGNVAAVQFGPVQHFNFLDLELNLGFGSAKALNLGQNVGSGFTLVQFRFRRGLNRLNQFFSHCHYVYKT